MQDGVFRGVVCGAGRLCVALLGVLRCKQDGVVWCVVLSSVLTLPGCPCLLLWTSRWTVSLVQRGAPRFVASLPVPLLDVGYVCEWGALVYASPMRCFRKGVVPVCLVVLPCCCSDGVLSPRVQGTPMVLCVTFAPLPGVESASAVFPLGLGISPWPAPGPVRYVTKDTHTHTHTFRQVGIRGPRIGCRNTMTHCRVRE